MEKVLENTVLGHAGPAVHARLIKTTLALTRWLNQEFLLETTPCFRSFGSQGSAVPMAHVSLSLSPGSSRVDFMDAICPSGVRSSQTAPWLLSSYGHGML